MPRLRVAAYNVHGFRSGVAPLARSLAEAAPDVLLLNEARFRWRIRRFAAHLGMQAVHGLRLLKPVTNAVLVRPPWRIVWRQGLDLSRTARLKRRGALAVRAGKGGFRVTLVSVHLGVSDPERERHAIELTGFLEQTPGPIVLGGDLNEGPDRPAAAWLMGKLVDAFSAAGTGPAETFPTAAPRARIDYLFVSEGVRVERAWVGTGIEESDHLPVLADLLLD